MRNGKLIKLGLVLTLLPAPFMGGCAMNEAQQGEVIGGGGGALVGGVVGRQLGGRPGMIAGAMFGGLTGAVVGQQVGNTVAQEKAEARSDRASLEQQLASAKATEEQAASENDRLRNEIAGLEQQRNSIAASDLSAKKQVIYADVTRNEGQIDAAIASNTAAKLTSDASSDEISQLDVEIDHLKQKKQELSAMETKLQQL